MGTSSEYAIRVIFVWKLFFQASARDSFNERPENARKRRENNMRLFPAQWRATEISLSYNVFRAILNVCRSANGSHNRLCRKL